MVDNPYCLGQLADLEAGVSRIAAAVVRRSNRVVRLEDFDQACVFALVASSDFSLKRQEPKAPDGVVRNAAMRVALSLVVSIRSSSARR